MAENSVLVGIPSGSAKNQRKDEDTFTNANIGFVMEYGAPEINVPARPFLIPGVNSVWSEIQKRLSKGAKKLLTDPSFSVKVLLESTGLMAQNGVQKYMTDAHFVPLSDSTLAARRRKGRMGTKPLIDTGALRQSITFVVKDEK